MDVLIVIGIMFAIILAIFLLCCFKDFLDKHEKAYDIFTYTIAGIFITLIFIAILSGLFLISHNIAVYFNWIEPFLN